MAFTRLVMARGRSYLDEEIAPGRPILLPIRRPEPPDGEYLFRVEVAGERGDEVTVLPCYVPADILLSYEAFAVFVLEITGRPFSFTGYEDAPSRHLAKAAWRRHVHAAIAGDPPPPGPAAPAASPELSGAAVVAWRVGWHIQCVECVQFDSRSPIAPVFESELAAMKRKDCDACGRDLLEVARGESGTSSEGGPASDDPPV